MVKKVLFDTNILIDVLAGRQPFLEESKKVWNAHVDGIIDGYVVAVSLTNFFYISRRLANLDEAWKGLRAILSTFFICEVNANILNKAARLSGKDFEDNVQIACAMTMGMDAIVTRDPSGFENISIPVLSPSELIKQLDLNGEKHD